MQTVIFDICGTLFNSNTTFDFIRFLKKRSLYLKLLDFIIVKMIIVFLGKIVGCDLYRVLYIRSLKGYDRLTLLKVARYFYLIELRNKKIDVTHDILSRCKVSGDRIIYCSASLDVIVESVAESLGGEYLSSSLSFNSDGVCLGFLSNDLLGHKEDLFFGADIDLVVTDNISDLNLVKLSKKSFIVSKHKNVGFWSLNKIPVDFILS